jgi:hypothetical protein
VENVQRGVRRPQEQRHRPRAWAVGALLFSHTEMKAIQAFLWQPDEPCMLLGGNIACVPPPGAALMLPRKSGPVSIQRHTARLNCHMPSDGDSIAI